MNQHRETETASTQTSVNPWTARKGLDVKSLLRGLVKARKGRNTMQDQPFIDHTRPPAIIALENVLTGERLAIGIGRVGWPVLTPGQHPVLQPPTSAGKSIAIVIAPMRYGKGYPPEHRSWADVDCNPSSRADSYTATMPLRPGD